MSSINVGYSQVLRRNPDFARLWLGQLVSNLGDWFNTVAVLALVYDLTHSSFATGLILIASTLPSFLLTPFAGYVVDRFDRRRVMILADSVRALMALGMILVRTSDQIWLLYVFSILLIAFSSFFGPALSAALPNLVRREELISANALSSSTWGLMLAVGAAVGGIVIATVGRDAAFIINSLSFLFSAAMIFSIHKPFGQPHQPQDVTQPQRPNAWQEFRSSLSLLRTQPQMSTSVLVKTGIGVAGGVILLLTIFSKTVFFPNDSAAGDAGIGWLYAARGLGVLLGPTLVRSVVGHDLGRMRRAIMIGLVVAGLGYLSFSLAQSFWLAAVFVMLAHMGNGVAWVLSSTMLQFLTPDHFRGRIFAIDYGLNTVTNAFATFIVGAVLEKWDARGVALAMSTIFVLYALVWGVAVVISQRRSPQSWLASPRAASAASAEPSTQASD
ncbi:MAG TPA: MFS transporter [Anaerolineae bacterium]|nr:MFS transporter [Anaerolineae bacterium]